MVKEPKDLYNEINSQQTRVTQSGNKLGERERLKNILIGNVDDILEALHKYTTAFEEIKILEIELNDADQEIKEKDEKIKELTAASIGKTQTKKKVTLDIDEQSV